MNLIPFPIANDTLLCNPIWKRKTGAKANTYSYDAFGVGRSASETVENDFRFQTKPLDSDIGQYYFVARQYDQGTGRFVERDPRRKHIQYLYSPFQNNPALFVDPRGTQSRNMQRLLENLEKHDVPTTLVDELAEHGSLMWFTGPKPRYPRRFRVASPYVELPSRFSACENFFLLKRNLSPSQLGMVMNEIFHAWWEQVLEEQPESQWLHRTFRRIANLRFNGNMEALEEALSESISQAVWHASTKAKEFRKPTFETTAQPVQHPRRFPELSDRKITKMTYDILVHTVKWGSERPPGNTFSEPNEVFHYMNQNPPVRDGSYQKYLELEKSRKNWGR